MQQLCEIQCARANLSYTPKFHMLKMFPFVSLPLNQEAMDHFDGYLLLIGQASTESVFILRADAGIGNIQDSRVANWGAFLRCGGCKAQRRKGHKKPKIAQEIF